MAISTAFVLIQHPSLALRQLEHLKGVLNRTDYPGHARLKLCFYHLREDHIATLGEYGSHS